MASFLSNIIGNPFATQIGQSIEKAANVTESFENWALYMEICDLINNSDDGPRDAIKAFKKLIATNEGRNEIVLNQTMTVLETCVKNCGHRFHVLVAQRDFLQEIVKLLTTKVMLSQVTMDRVLGLLQTWADAFQGVNGLEEVSKVNKELKDKGFEFPIVDVEHAPPIHTPARKTNIPMEHVSATEQHHDFINSNVPLPGSINNINNSNLNASIDEIAAPQGFFIDASQMAKLKSELDVVMKNCKVFSELLNENVPGQENEDDWKLMNELNEISMECHKRLVDLVRKYTIENLTCDILPVNDEVTNVMLRFERYKNRRQLVTDSNPTTADDLACISPESAAIQVGKVAAADDDAEISGFLESSLKMGGGGSAGVGVDGGYSGHPSVFNPFVAPKDSIHYKSSSPKEVELSNVKDANSFNKSTNYLTNTYTNQELLIDVPSENSNENNNLKEPLLPSTASSQEFDKFLASKTSENLTIDHITSQETTNLISKDRNKEDELFGL